MAFGVLCLETVWCLSHRVDSCWQDMRYRMLSLKTSLMNEIQDSLFHESKDKPILKSDRKQRISHFWYLAHETWFDLEKSSQDEDTKMWHISALQCLASLFYLKSHANDCHWMFTVFLVALQDSICGDSSSSAAYEIWIFARSATADNTNVLETDTLSVRVGFLLD